MAEKDLAAEVAELKATVALLTRVQTPQMQVALSEQQFEERYARTKAVADIEDLRERAKAVAALKEPADVKRCVQHMPLARTAATLGAMKASDRERVRTTLSAAIGPEFLLQLDASVLPIVPRVRLTLADPRGAFDESVGVRGARRSDDIPGTRLVGEHYIGTTVGAVQIVLTKREYDGRIAADPVVASAVRDGRIVVTPLTDEESGRYMVEDLRVLRS